MHHLLSELLDMAVKTWAKAIYQSVLLLSPAVTSLQYNDKKTFKPAAANLDLNSFKWSIQIVNSHNVFSLE